MSNQFHLRWSNLNVKETIEKYAHDKNMSKNEAINYFLEIGYKTFSKEKSRGATTQLDDLIELMNKQHNIIKKEIIEVQAGQYIDNLFSGNIYKALKIVMAANGILLPENINFLSLPSEFNALKAAVIKEMSED